MLKYSLTSITTSFQCQNSYMLKDLRQNIGNRQKKIPTKTSSAKLRFSSKQEINGYFQHYISVNRIFVIVNTYRLFSPFVINHDNFIETKLPLDRMIQNKIHHSIWRPTLVDSWENMVSNKFYRFAGVCVIVG